MTAFLFLPLLAATWIVGLVVVAHAAHYFLTVVESSATGTARNLTWKARPFREWIRDGINWPDEGFIDYFAKAVYFVYLVLIWGGPTVVIGRLTVGGDSPWATVIAGAAFWLLFPIGLLSSLASESRWTPFRPELLMSFARRPGKTLGFYLLSAPILAVLSVTFHLILLQSDRVSTTWAIALSPVAVLLFFVYARLLGRLGLVVTYTRTQSEEKEPKPTPRRKKKRQKPAHAYDEKTRWCGPTEAIPDEPPLRAQPDDLPGVQTPFDGPLTGYGVDYEGRLPTPEEPKPARVVYPGGEDDDLTPITVAPPPDVSTTDRAKVAAALVVPRESEVELFLRERPTEPANPYGAETVTFLFDPKTLDPWLRLSVGLVVMALLQRALDSLRPVLE
ncbi:MAG TPA: hypothetical protein VKD90_00945 [Gemmataceae bacterium]|nr:hypothetical protein [Gemmataceae bacterium]